MLMIRVYTHWGTHGYPQVALPRSEQEAMELYSLAAASEARRGAVAQGCNGVTVFRRPPTIKGIVRGLDQYDQPTFYLITEEGVKESGDGK